MHQQLGYHWTSKIFWRNFLQAHFETAYLVLNFLRWLILYTNSTYVNKFIISPFWSFPLPIIFSPITFLVHNTNILQLSFYKNEKSCLKYKILSKVYTPNPWKKLLYRIFPLTENLSTNAFKSFQKMFTFRSIFLHGRFKFNGW